MLVGFNFEQIIYAVREFLICLFVYEFIGLGKCLTQHCSYRSLCQSESFDLGTQLDQFIIGRRHSALYCNQQKMLHIMGLLEDIPVLGIMLSHILK